MTPAIFAMLEPFSTAHVPLGTIALEFAPLIVVGVCLAIKFLYLSFAFSLPDFPLQRAVWSATLGCLTLVAAPFLLVPLTWRLVLLLAVDFGLSVVMLGDMLHLRFFRDVMSVAARSSLRELHMGLSSIAATLRPSHALLFLDVLALGLLLPFFFGVSTRQPPLGLEARAMSCVVLATAGLLLGLPAALLAWRDREGVFEYVIERRQVVTAVGLLPYHLYDAVITAWYPLAGRWRVGPTEIEQVRRFLSQREAWRGSPSSLFGVAQGRNVILLMCESLQAFPLDLRVGSAPVMPNLEALRSQSLYFENFYDQSHWAATSDGEFTSLQSLHPLEAGAVATRYPLNQFRALPAILADRGYATLSAIGQQGDVWNMKSFHPRLGFQKLVYMDDLAPGERIGLGLSDRDFFRQMLPILREQRFPFLSFLITLTNHHPFALPAHYADFEVGRLRGTVLGNYVQSVHHFDRVLGEFLAGLRASGLLDTSVLVLYGDHQAWLEETPELATLLGFPPGDVFQHWLARKRIPFLIRLPGGAPAARHAVTAGHLDIAPTVLGLLGIKEPQSVMLGEDVTRPRRSPVVYRDGSFSDGVRHWISPAGPVWAGKCFEQPDGRVLPCAGLAEKQALVREQLLVSDLIIRGDLIARLRAER
jgi:lipoteichoic acid synthase